MYALEFAVLKPYSVTFKGVWGLGMGGGLAVLGFRGCMLESSACKDPKPLKGLGVWGGKAV